MKPLLAMLVILASSVDGAAADEIVRPRPSKPIIHIPATDDCELYSNPPSCVYAGRRAAAVHLFHCRRGIDRCALPDAQPLHQLLLRFTSARIVKISPQRDGCSRITVVGAFKLTDAPPWAGTAYPGWRPYVAPPPVDDAQARPSRYRHGRE